MKKKINNLSTVNNWSYIFYIVLICTFLICGLVLIFVTNTDYISKDTTNKYVVKGHNRFKRSSKLVCTLIIPNYLVKRVIQQFRYVIIKEPRIYSRYTELIIPFHKEKIISILLNIHKWEYGVSDFSNFTSINLIVPSILKEHVLLKINEVTGSNKKVAHFYVLDEPASVLTNLRIPYQGLEEEFFQILTQIESIRYG